MPEMENRLGYLITKRALDIVVSSLILLILAPVLLGIWCYIRRHSTGPVIFHHTRIKKNRRKTTRSKARNAPAGRNSVIERRKTNNYGEPFTFYKFATMYPDARQRFPKLYAYKYNDEEIQSLHFKIKNDPRIPPWAHWLRRCSLDELPNFVNVLRGEMSLVGPRPDIPEMTKYYTQKQQRLKFSVKPGVTGFAQIRGRGDLSFKKTLEYDLEYVQNASFILDLKILIQTFLKLFKGRQGGAF